jgi:hypothetical protein
MKDQPTEGTIWMHNAGDFSLKNGDEIPLVYYAGGEVRVEVGTATVVGDRIQCMFNDSLQSEVMLKMIKEHRGMVFSVNREDHPDRRGPLLRFSAIPAEHRAEVESINKILGITPEGEA